MGQVLHGSAKTTYAVRAAIQRSESSLKELAQQYGINATTVAKWRKRDFVHDASMGAEEAVIWSADKGRGGDVRCLSAAHASSPNHPRLLRLPNPEGRIDEAGQFAQQGAQIQKREIT